MKCIIIRWEFMVKFFGYLFLVKLVNMMIIYYKLVMRKIKSFYLNGILEILRNILN